MIRITGRGDQDRPEWLIRINGMRNRLACAATGGPPVPRQVDQNTQRFDMHACPPGIPMAGVEVARNLLLCGTSNVVPSGEFIDVNTQRNSMHSCPFGTFMTGIHISNNLLLCSSAFGPYQAETADSSTQSFGMHACLEGAGMTGAQVNKNIFECAAVPASSERQVDQADQTERAGMHACPTGKPMSGLQAGQNLLVCGAEGDLRIIDFHTVPPDGVIQPGQSATLVWNVRCTVQGCELWMQGGTQPFPTLPLTGTQTVSPLGTTNTTYTLHATGGGGSVSQAVTVTTAAKPAKPIGK